MRNSCGALADSHLNRPEKLRVSVGVRVWYEFAAIGAEEKVHVQLSSTHMQGNLMCYHPTQDVDPESGRSDPKSRLLFMHTVIVW